MTFYSATTIIIALLMIAMSIHVLVYSGFNKKQKTWFIATFIAIMFCASAEFAVHCGAYDKIFKIPLTVLTIFQFSIAPCFAMLFAGALGLSKQKIVALVLFGVGLLTEVICAPFGWIFSFTDVEYVRGPAFIIYEIIYLASLVYMIVCLVIVGRKFKKRDLTTIIGILIVLAAGIVIMTIYKIHVAYLAVAVSSILCYVYYNDLIQEDTNAELRNQQDKMSKMQVEIIAGLANLIEKRDTETGEHITRTTAYVKTLAEDARAEGVYKNVLTDHYIALLCALAPMHDVGKILISDRILKKPGRLTMDEYLEIKKHAEFGGQVVRQVLSNITDEEYINFASDIATYHHEKWDGSGYPKGLCTDEIPLCARIMAIADVFDALVSKRCYKEAYPMEEAFDIIADESGTHFDPKLVQVFLKHKEKYEDIKNRFDD